MRSSSTAIWVRPPTLAVAGICRTTMTRSTASRRARNSDSDRIGGGGGGGGGAPAGGAARGVRAGGAHAPRSRRDRRAGPALFPAVAPALALGLEPGRTGDALDLVARCPRLPDPDHGDDGVVGGGLLGPGAPGAAGA